MGVMKFGLLKMMYVNMKVKWDVKRGGEDDVSFNRDSLWTYAV